MNEPIVYDKAKYHYGGDYPEELPIEQAFVHTGMFLGWVIDHNLFSEEFAEETGDLIAAFKSRRVTGREIYEHWDGALVDDMLSDRGNEFARYYYNFDKGDFLNDYDEVLGADLPSLYHVEDTWENYEKMKERIDQRYKDWERNMSKGEWKR